MSNRRALLYIGNQASLVDRNTYIGNVGSTSITSALDFATLSGELEEADVIGFVINSDNSVSFRIEKNYSLKAANAFNDDDDITYFIDKDGFNLSGNYFGKADFITHAYFPSALEIGNQFAFNDNTRLTHVNFESVTIASNRFLLSDAENLRVLKLSSLTSITNNGSQGVFSELRALEVLYIPLLTTFSDEELKGSYIRNVQRYPTFFKAGVNATNPICYYNSALGAMDRKAFIRIVGIYSIGDIHTINGLTYTAVTSPSDESEFDGSSEDFANKIINDTRTGDVNVSLSYYRDGDNITFLCETIGAIGNTITASSDPGNGRPTTWSTPTFIGGTDVHVVMMEVRDFGGATLVEVSTPITVNAPSNLSYVNFNVNSVDLVFTEPLANANGTIGFEVWINDGTVYRKQFEYSEITVVGNTVDLTEIIDDVGTANNSKVKIRTIDGHQNVSAFSNEVELIT